jgi:V/A-type H+-transporting ATPase subunit E
LSEKIIGDPKKLIDEALSGVEDELKAKLGEVEEGARRIIDDAVNEALREVEERVSKSLSSAQDRLRAEKASLEAKLRLSLAQKRSEWIDKVVEEAIQRLEPFFSTKEYRDMLARLVIQAVSQMEAEEVIIEANARDHDVLKDLLGRISSRKKLAEILNKLGIQVDPEKVLTRTIRLDERPASILGGIRARTPDSRVVIDYSLDLLVSRIARDQRATIARVLFGGEE